MLPTPIRHSKTVCRPGRHWSRRERLNCFAAWHRCCCWLAILHHHLWFLFFRILYPSMTVPSFLNPWATNDPVSKFLPVCSFIFLISALQTFSQLFLKLSNYLRSLSQGHAAGPHQCGAPHSWHAWDKLQRGTERDTYTTLPFIFPTRKRSAKQGIETIAKTLLYAEISL